MTRPIPSITFPDGRSVPVLGQGTWGMGEDDSKADAEANALRHGIDLGMTLIDTAEMYANGHSEQVVARAIKGQRDRVFLVSKVFPWNAGRSSARKACEDSLKRLETDHIDLYLLHWRGDVPLEETIEIFETLKGEGKIGAWGVSNLDMDDMAALTAIPAGNHVATNQVLYNLTRRGIEFDLLGLCRDRGIPIMAYSPIEQGALANDPALKAIADRHDSTPAQIALAFVLSQPGVIAIPKSSSPERLDENRKAVSIELTAEDRADLDAAFPPPTRAMPLEML